VRCLAERGEFGRHALGAGDHVAEGERVQMGPHVLAHLGPDVEQGTLPFVIAGAVLVRGPEVPDDDRSVDCRHDLAEGHVPWRSSEHVPAADAALGADEAGPFQGEQDLLEIGLGEPGTFGDIPDRGRVILAASKRQ
jgi:hypothetical protein